MYLTESWFSTGRLVIEFPRLADEGVAPVRIIKDSNSLETGNILIVNNGSAFHGNNL